MGRKIERSIQEYVPGKQVTLAHIVANPTTDIYEKLGIQAPRNALGILTITPSEASIIAGDIASKASNVTLGFIDRFSGSVVIVGEVAEVQSALRQVIDKLHELLGFDIPPITST
ncbi:PduU protein [Bombilactobacillus mellifer]|uniref:PduU protein n=1 Tax=Bombilactobacillus mellifer TaxID=1218492 RepID=A0A0F4LU37_9LACO|nr:BMC domain-containing protein [Bombilactobacillus mellifer]MBH9991075.1 BMC domain-containing protein [Lactobacillus sp. W8092]KJY62272.1 PduU protein [Bombilactobacillus mellifer]MCT6826669.1 BMC domain-containing protein [Bombilactobacillus mellifer]MCT6843538.1 BMC domain-containing protein [Bombilactobacillus mellifer]MCT6894440.1 BMC domain-containing protein [Bombilactobacillus mellifer]